MSAHELVLGETVDFITGETLIDTIDERARQEIARFLVNEKGYLKEDIRVRRPIALDVDGNKGTFIVNFVVHVSGKAFMIIIFGPGSLVSRERPALAAARLVEPYTVPFTVVTNGRSAEVLETQSGHVIAEGLENIPSKEQALERFKTVVFETLAGKHMDRERRILYAFEVLAERECDEFTCSLY
ncbi:MAG: type I restriction enzyme HsdR N-terminal domain-containing protein [Deltaproteobacteria bacterium]|jgi:hypothetical protein